MSRVSIVALEYEEKAYSETRKCIEATGLPVVYTSRDGVGNMSRAFNNGFKELCKKRLDSEYTWFITNITFDKNIPDLLADALDVGYYEAIHPEFPSDHKHIRKNGWEGVVEIPFLEFTAPMIKTSVFSKLLLDEDHWYYYMDLIISKEMREEHAIKIACHHDAPVGHVYLRNNGQKEPITRLREQLRVLREPIERKLLVEKYGKDWEKYLFNYEC